MPKPDLPKTSLDFQRLCAESFWKPMTENQAARYRAVSCRSLARDTGISPERLFEERSNVLKDSGSASASKNPPLLEKLECGRSAYVYLSVNGQHISCNVLCMFVGAQMGNKPAMGKPRIPSASPLVKKKYRFRIRLASYDLTATKFRQGIELFRMAKPSNCPVNQILHV